MNSMKELWRIQAMHVLGESKKRGREGNFDYYLEEVCEGSTDNVDPGTLDQSDRKLESDGRVVFHDLEGCLLWEHLREQQGVIAGPAKGAQEPFFASGP